MNLKEIDPYQVIDFTEWQNVLDILANISGAKSAAITKIDLPFIYVLKITATPDIPLCEGMSTELVNHYCGAVLNTQKEVQVTNALKQEKWKNAPEIKYGLISYLGYPLFLPNGEVFGTLCIHNDQETVYSQQIHDLMHQFKKIVESHFAMAEQTRQLKESEEAVRSSEARFRTLIENSPDTIFVQTQGRFAYLNSAALSHFGAQNESELLGKPVMEMFHPDFHEKVRERIYRLNIEKKQVPRSEEVHLKLDGTPVEVELSAVPIHYEGLDGALVFAREISERRQLEQLREDVDRITRHDLKSPLNGIVGLPQMLLEDDNLTDEQRETVRFIRDSGSRMLRKINQSLDLFKMETGTYEYTPREVNIVAVLKDVLKECDSAASKKAIAMSLTFNGESAPLSFLVQGEELLLYTMLSNFISNAIEASPKGESVVVDISDMPDTCIKITNRGVVPVEIRENFFQKYITRGKKQGTGLGTYSAQLIADTMGYGLRLDLDDEENTTTITVIAK